MINRVFVFVGAVAIVLSIVALSLGHGTLFPDIVNGLMLGVWFCSLADLLDGCIAAARRPKVSP